MQLTVVWLLSLAGWPVACLAGFLCLLHVETDLLMCALLLCALQNIYPSGTVCLSILNEVRQRVSCCSSLLDVIQQSCATRTSSSIACKQTIGCCVAMIWQMWPVHTAGPCYPKVASNLELTFFCAGPNMAHVRAKVLSSAFVVWSMSTRAGFTKG